MSPVGLHLHTKCRLTPKPVQAARKTGATAKFAGFGGAIVGTYRDQAQFKQLREELAKIGVAVIQPKVTLD